MSLRPRIILTALCWTLFPQHSFWTRGPQTTPHMVVLMLISSSTASFLKMMRWCWKPLWRQVSTVTPPPPVPTARHFITAGNFISQAKLDFMNLWPLPSAFLPCYMFGVDSKRLHFLHLCRIWGKANCTPFSISKTATSLAQSPRPSLSHRGYS